MVLERGEGELVLEDLPRLRQTRRWFDIVLSIDYRHTGFEIRGADAQKESSFHFRWGAGARAGDWCQYGDLQLRFRTAASPPRLPGPQSSGTGLGDRSRQR